MNHSSRFSLSASLVALLAAGASAPNAYASGFQLREQSASAQGSSFAGVSAGGSDISGMFFNPAGLTQFSGLQFSIGATYVMPVAEFANGSASRAPIFPAAVRPISGPSSHPDSAKDALLPTFGVMWSATPDLKLGLTVNVPFGMVTDYNADFIGRYHARKSDLRTLDLAPTVAYRIGKGWSVGASFVARRTDAELTNAVDFGAIGAAVGIPGSIPGGADGLATLKGNKWNYGYRAGITFEPTETFRIGLAHSGAVKVNLDGTISYAGVPALLASNFKNGSASAEVELPATTSLGTTYKVSPAFTLQAEAARTDWSGFQELRVKFGTGQADSVTHENWRDTWFLSLGGTYKLNEALTLRGGLASDQGAAPDAYRTPRIPDADRTWASLGLAYQLTKSVALDAAYTHIWVKSAPVGLATGTSPSNPDFFRGNLSGEYTNRIDMLALQLRWSF